MVPPKAPSLGRLRLATPDDASAILGLVNESISENFRIHSVPDIIYLIENCVLSICLLDVHNAIIGFLSLKDYPLLPSVHPVAWEEYIWTKYKTTELNARNTLWIHLLCWSPSYAREAVDKMLKSIFMHDCYVNHIAVIKTLIVTHPLLIPGQSRSESSFRRAQAMERGMPGDQMPILCIADRTEVSPRLRIRRAVEEDNDDIVPILEQHSKKLQQMYGEFYVSELISRHPESERVLLVCEHNEVAVGVMCINTQINFETLEENFELGPYAGLRHVTCNPHKRESDWNLDSGSFVSNTSTVQPQDLRVHISPKDAKSRVTWMGSEVEEVSEKPVDVNKVQMDAFNFLDEEDDDQLEYDIINIDTDLLKGSDLMSLEKKLSIKTQRSGSESKQREHQTEKSVRISKTRKSLVPMNIAMSGPEPYRFKGTPNAFLLELFAMHHDYDERYGFDMLEATYELFPDRDYCIICTPSNQPSFPLLEHFTLVTSYGNKMRFINESLYVAHVNSVRGNISVRPGEANDLMKLADILEHAPRAELLYDLFETTINSNTFFSFVLLSQKQPIGIAVLGPLESGTAIRTQFDLDPEPRRAQTDATIIVCVMSPVLEPHGRWFLREFLRQTHFTTLFWGSHLFAKGDASPRRNLMSLSGHMMPVHPRRSIPNITGNSQLDKIFEDISNPYALWVLERPMTSLPLIYVNNSIVVIGASRTGLAFIETLMMGPTAQYLIFSNITLVSEHGLPTVGDCLKAAETCVPREGRYNDFYIKSVPFYFYVDIMPAIMTSIDRQKKCIHFKGGGVKFYDELVLTCGQQFQHPDYLYESLELVKEVEKGKPCERILMDNPAYMPDRVPESPEMPDNLMLINSLYEANYCLRKLLKMISDLKVSKWCLSQENQIIVYGESVEAYSCITALMELEIAPDMITFVETFPPHDASALRVNCFNNETVDERVQASLKKQGIRILRRCTLSDWDANANHIISVTLMAPLHAVILPCFALFYYSLKAIDINAFKAINECGLVYDGGLIVGPAFETNDPCIYGAGTCAKYSRSLYATKYAHRNYCSEDVGEALARIFLRKLDPYMMGDPHADNLNITLRHSSTFLLPRNASTNVSGINIAFKSQRRWQPVSKFESPIAISATLPGPLYYMMLRKPGLDIPMEVQLSLPHQGHILITDKRKNYFRLHLNVLHCIQGVTCLSKKFYSTDILSQLYGKHEAFFDKLLARHKLGLVDDFYEYFTQPWMGAMYQETFTELITDINEQDVGTVFDLLKSKFNLSDRGKAATHKSLSNMTLECGYGATEARNLGTFRNIIDKFVARTQIVTIRKDCDIPKECGQDAVTHEEVRGFWKVVGGDRIAIAHIASYLTRNSVINPQYATPNNDFI